MKQLILNILIPIILVSTGLTSCKKDNTELTNQLLFGTSTYELTSGFIEYHGQWNDNMNSYNFDIKLYSTGFNLDERNNPSAGKGHYFRIELFSASAEELLPGTYAFDKDVTYNPLTFNKASFAINYDVSLQYGDMAGEISGGSVTISKSAGDYDIEINCTTLVGSRLSGSFKGALKFNDFTEQEK